MGISSGGGAGPGDIFDVARFSLVRRLPTVRVVFTLSKCKKKLAAPAEKWREPISPINLRLHGKARVQDGPRSALKNLKSAADWFEIRVL